ncbi:uncharacterized protein [Blastocystis hominis]|uniref:NADP-dependent oxidoreductase domain-containing protein n=1 Tax=Blastocystis hominis TaxID=12968 RepID=D8LYD9_BLAHO|nr:uncharacterized protein [Blastocystis hominis]CBK20594.2 unnamed protein product [Blastocystis hominis]|eukprot:XP_012894642.1 uncharacterized protein [Blastocystis hominis]
MLHGLLTADSLPRSAFVLSSKIYSHQRSGQAYSPQQLRQCVDLSLSQLGVDALDFLTLEIPPFITDSQLAMALYHIRVSTFSTFHTDRNRRVPRPLLRHRRHVPLHRRRLASRQASPRGSRRRLRLLLLLDQAPPGTLRSPR